jgi:hypothetical protein
LAYESQARERHQMGKLYDLMNVRFNFDEAIATGRLSDRKPTICPRVFTVHQVEYVAESQITNRVLTASFEPRQTAIVDARQSGLPIEALKVEQRDGIQIVTYREEIRTVQVDMVTAGLLVFSEHNYPGWQVSIDGAATMLLDVDGVITGVTVPAGKHLVELRFRPRSVFYGVGITGTTIALLCGVFSFAGLTALRSRSRA